VANTNISELYSKNPKEPSQLITAGPRNTVVIATTCSRWRVGRHLLTVLAIVTGSG
jgi:hypothetical protein